MSGFTAQSPWSLHYTEEGQPYYYNSITYETQWNDPASAEIVGSAGPDSTGDFEADAEDLEPDACEFKIGLLFELEKKKFFLFRSSEDEFYSSSMKKVAEKLQFLQSALQSQGSDLEWATAMRHNDFALVEYLLSFITARIPDRATQEGAVRCLALVGNIFPSLWVEYSDDANNLHRLLLSCHIASVALAEILSRFDDDKLEQTDVPYAGYDERDKKDFNIEGYAKSPRRRRSTHGLAGMEELSDNHAHSLVWLLLIYQMYVFELPSLSSLIRTQRVADLGFETTAATASDAAATKAASVAAAEAVQGDEDDESNSKVAPFLAELVESLLKLAPKLTEDAYLQCIKSIAAINMQFPPLDVVGSTEGLLHIINEVGYPNHLAREAIPALKMCVDLVDTYGSEGYFYTNDVKVLVDVIIRELSNLPLDCGAPDTEAVQVIYIRLLSSLIGRSAWQGAGEKYRSSLIKEVVQTFTSGAAGGQAQRVAVELLQDFEDELG